MAKNAVKATDITDAIYKKHKDIISENALDIHTMRYDAYHSYDNRELTGLAKITNMTLKIKSYEGNVPHTYTFDEIPKLRERMAKDANEIHVIYMELLECLKDIEVNEMLIQVLQILQSFRAIGIMYNAMHNIKVNYNGAENDLYGFISNTMSHLGIRDKHIKLYELQCIEQKIAEIALLERKGEQIIFKKYKDWYETHKFVDNKWEEIKENTNPMFAQSAYKEYHNPFPWLNKRIRHHRIKENQVFVLNSAQKIKVLLIGDYNELINEAYNMPRTESEEVLYNNDLRYDRSDYISQSLLIKHIGEINNDMLQVITHYELRDILVKNEVYERYAAKCGI